MHYTTQTIAGISTVFAPMRDATSTCIQVLVKAGSIYEDKTTNGLSHFLEHMFFKGGARYKTPLEVSEALDTLGASYNAFTGDEYAGYWVKCAPQFTEKAIDILSDMLVHPTFPEEEMQREKSVVIQEIMMYEDDPSGLVMDKWKNRYYGDTNYGRSILGTKENVESFTREMLLEHKQKLYTKDNIVIAVAGAIPDEDVMRGLIEKFFDALPATANYDLSPFDPNHYPTSQQNHYVKDTQQNHLIIGSAGFSIHESERYAARLAMTIFGGMMSSRLFQNIREKLGLCYYVGATHASGNTNGMFLLYAGIEKERWALGLQAMYDETARIVEGGITQQEFEKAIKNIEGGTALGLETSNQVAGFVANQMLFQGKIETLDQRLKHYQALDVKSVNSILGRLHADHLYTYRIE